MTNVTDALRTGGKRTRTHDAQMVLKLPSAAKALVESIGAKSDESAGAIVREAIAEYLEKRGYRL